MSRHVVNLKDQRFGRLVALSRAINTPNNKAQWVCLCDCGNKHVASASNLRQGEVRSCGCLQKESALRASKCAAAALYKHGMSGTRLAGIFKGMVQRCNNPNATHYTDYGGRGIKICEEWLNDRACFFEWAEKHGYAPNLTIDRIDNNDDYKPSNCRWTDRKTQANNTRGNKIIEHQGQSLTLSEWASKTRIPMKTLWMRLYSGWTIEKALMTPLRGR